jgi:integrase
MQEQQKPPGVYHAKGRLYVREFHQGKRKQAPFSNAWLRERGLTGSGKDATRLERIRGELRRQIVEELNSGLEPGMALSVPDAVHAFLKARENAPRTSRPGKKQQDRLRTTLLTGTHNRPPLAKHLGARARVKAVRPDDLAALQRKYESVGLSQNSVRSFMSDCRTFFSWCEEQGAIAKSPFGRGRYSIPPVAGLPEEQLPYDTWELEQFAQALKVGHPLHRTWMLSRSTGARRSELLRLRFQDIDWEKNVIRIRGAAKNPEKQMKPRLVPLLPKLREFLLEQQEQSSCFISSLSVEPWTENAFRSSVRRFNRKHGFGLSTQKMRRTFAQIMANSGMAIEKIAETLGNSPETLRTWYIQPAPQVWDSVTIAALERGAVVNEPQPCQQLRQRAGAK